jgi:hypothetical protein
MAAVQGETAINLLKQSLFDYKNIGKYSFEE